MKLGRRANGALGTFEGLEALTLGILGRFHRSGIMVGIGLANSVVHRHEKTTLGLSCSESVSLARTSQGLSR